MAKYWKENHPAEKYARDVINGNITACKWARLACERHVHDLEHGHERGLYFDADAAERVLKFMSMLRHSKGKWGRGVGELIRLEPWQQFIVWAGFGWKREDGMRRFRTIYLEVARKNGKSTMSAGLGLYLAFADGEPGAEVYCLHPTMKILYDDLTWRPIGDAQIGDKLVAFDENAPEGKGKYRKARVSEILGIRHSFTTAYRINFENGHSVICSGSHKWLSRSFSGSNLHWRATNDLQSGCYIRFLGLPWEVEDTRTAGYLAGLFDGEGYFHSPLAERTSFRVGFAQKPGIVMDECVRALRSLGFDPAEPRPQGISSAYTLEVTGLYDVLRLLGQVRPARLYPRHHEIWEGRALNRSGAHLRIASIEPLGEQELIDIETSTGTFIAEGLFSHNSAATKRDQARIVHKEAIRMVKKNAGLRKFVKIYKDNLNLEKTNSKYEPLGADSDSTDGLNIHGIVGDEIHAWKTRDMWDVLETATGSREQPMFIAITTAGMDRQSVCFEKHDYTRKIMEGWQDSSFVDDTWFGMIFTLDEGDDWRDESTWIKANPNLGASKYIEDLRMKAQRAEKMPTAQNNFLRREMNIWVHGESKWADMDAWRECSGLIDALDLPERLKDRVCYAGLDLSSTNDLTALALAFPDKDGMIDVVLRFWLPEDAITPRTQEGTHYEQWVREGYIEATDGNVIDYDWIFAKLNEDMKNHRIERLAYDRWGAARVVQVIQNMGIEVVQFGQGFASMNPPMKELERLILARKIRHGNNPVLTWMMDNVVARMDPAGNIKPDKEKSKEKIDGAVALIMALDMALRADPAPDMSAIMNDDWGM